MWEFGEGQTDRQTHTHTQTAVTSIHISRLRLTRNVINKIGSCNLYSIHASKNSYESNTLFNVQIRGQQAVTLILKFTQKITFNLVTTDVRN